MKPAPFKYIAASSLAHALALKAEFGDEARFLAGGQSLVPAMNFRLARPAVLIDINGLDTLARLDRMAGEVRVGALTRYRALERDPGFLAACPLFAQALPHVAHPQIRNRGTLGGNLCHADPASELPAVALAMRARMRLQSSRTAREVAAADFFRGLLATAVGPDEMLVEIRLPDAPPRSGSCFLEVARRRGDFAMAGVAAMVAVDADRRCTDARLALCGVGETPVDAGAAAALLIGEPAGDAVLDAAAATVMGTIAPVGNVHATADYQRHLAGVLTRRAVAAAFEGAVGAA